MQGSAPFERHARVHSARLTDPAWLLRRSNTVVRVIPAARPFAEITRAIFRLASSIISSPSIAAPRAPRLPPRCATRSVEDHLGLVVVRLPRTEHLVGCVDLARMQHPLTVEAERGGALRGPAERVDVTNLQVGGRRWPAVRGRARP